MQLNRTPIIDTLTGSFLVSTPRMPDPRFEEQVILICAHNNEGRWESRSINLIPPSVCRKS